jgi:hypothetical protein
MQKSILNIESKGGTSYKVEIDFQELLPDLSKRANPHVDDLLMNMSNYDAYYAQLLVEEELKMIDLKNEMQEMESDLITYFTNVPSTRLAKKIGVPPSNKNLATITFVKSCMHKLGKTYGEVTNEFDDTKRLIFDGDKYNAYRRMYLNCEKNVTVLKTLIKLRKDFQQNVRVINSNNKFQLQNG